MMARIHGAAVLAIFLVATAALAQGPLQAKVHYTINVPHELSMGGYLLPPGRYELYQVNTTDPNLFGLYPKDTSHSPLALIRTTRVRRESAPPPEEATIRLEIDEESATGATPALRGWTAPGEDAWEIIAVDAKDGKLVRVK
jgi:hypothetical protein